MKLIHQLSKATDLPIGTIRFYENLGLFSGRQKTDVKSNNYFYYDDEVIERLELIKEAKGVGFTLQEIKEVINAWYNNTINKSEKFEILDKKITQIEQKIADLQKMKQRIHVLKQSVENDQC